MGQRDSFRDPELQRAGAGEPALDAPTIYSFRRPERDWIGWLFDELIPLPSSGVVVDVGCGPGPYVPAARARVSNGLVLPLDISFDRLCQIEAPSAAVQGDVCALPVAEGSGDVALAMHMLYHLPDVPAGVREIRRVLRPGGTLYALTNSAYDMPELAELYHACGLGRVEGMGGLAFTAENGAELLRIAFAHVETIELHNSSLVVTDPAAVVGEAARLRYTMEPQLDHGLDWDAFLARVEAAATEIVDEHGAFEINEHQALFVAS